MISFNTRALTLRALETLYATTLHSRLQTIVVDNASDDGSAAAIAAAFPQVDLIALSENLGFARANNLAAQQAQAPWLLLLNPDTECQSGAVDALMAFSRANPQAGITGGRTVFPDGRLNIASCWMRITPWSAFCAAIGLSTLLPRVAIFNPEGMGRWPRDTIRQVDIVVGCFMMLPLTLWRDLGGFDLRYFMYGEEADLCLRARALGFRPMITPRAQIMHLVGASSALLPQKYAMIAKARMTLMQDHWPAMWVPFGRAMLCLWAGSRALLCAVLARTGHISQSRAALWLALWRSRGDWMKGY